MNKFNLEQTNTGWLITDNRLIGEPVVAEIDSDLDICFKDDDLLFSVNELKEIINLIEGLENEKV